MRLNETCHAHQIRLYHRIRKLQVLPPPIAPALDPGRILSSQTGRCNSSSSSSRRNNDNRTNISSSHSSTLRNILNTTCKTYNNSNNISILPTVKVNSHKTSTEGQLISLLPRYLQHYTSLPSATPLLIIPSSSGSIFLHHPQCFLLPHTRILHCLYHHHLQDRRLSHRRLA